MITAIRLSKLCKKVTKLPPRLLSVSGDLSLNLEGRVPDTGIAHCEIRAGDAVPIDTTSATNIVIRPRDSVSHTHTGSSYSYPDIYEAIMPILSDIQNIRERVPLPYEDRRINPSVLPLGCTPLINSLYSDNSHLVDTRSFSEREPAVRRLTADVFRSVIR